jgi:hypothetical protein
VLAALAEKAFLTSRWTEVQAPPADTMSVALDENECRQRFALAEGMKARFDAMSRDHPRIDVVYEELEDDHAREMARV